MKHNKSVLAGSVHTDTITTVNFGYSFGNKPICACVSDPS